MTQSECVAGAVPAAADAWTNVGTFTVPAGVQRMKQIAIGCACDWGVAATTVRKAPMIRLLGSGLLEQSPHLYVGPFGGQVVVTAGAFGEDISQIEYEIDIPVQTGGTITVDCDTLDEAITAGTVIVEVQYDNNAPALPCSMSDYVDAAGPLAAGVWTAVGTLQVPQAAQGRTPTRIREIAVGFAVDSGAGIVGVRDALMVRLSGSGLAEGGMHQYLGNCGFMGGTTSGGFTLVNTTRKISTDIPVNAGGSIVVESLLTTEFPAASTVAVGVLYA